MDQNGQIKLAKRQGQRILDLLPHRSEPLQLDPAFFLPAEGVFPHIETRTAETKQTEEALLFVKYISIMPAIS